jgi:hypothetical protein
MTNPFTLQEVAQYLKMGTSALYNPAHNEIIVRDGKRVRSPADVLSLDPVVHIVQKPYKRGEDQQEDPELLTHKALKRLARRVLSGRKSRKWFYLETV